MDVQMRSANLNLCDPISASAIHHTFKTARDSNGIHERAVMWLLRYFMRDQIKSALAHRVCATKEDDPQKERKLMTYCKVVSYLIATYASDDVMANAEADITNFKQPEGMPPYITRIG